MAGFDYLDVSRRSFSRIDFRLTDSYGKTINLKNAHWSLSIIFKKNKDIQHCLLILYVLYRITKII